MGKLLDRINKPNDVKKLSANELPALAKEMRRLIINSVAENGGHLASSLGTVELTIALHRVLDFPQDRLIFDVGHQAYSHKILTGRKEGFKSLRKYGGMSGFPKRGESDCDAFDVGHSSTSISVAAGMARARELKKEHYRIVAVIGDGAMSGGLAYEAFNNIGQERSNIIIILNDNEMSISKNVGGMANYLDKIRLSSQYIGFKGSLETRLNRTELGTKVAKGLKKTKDSIKQAIIPGDFFQEMGINYFGPFDGHDISELTDAFSKAEKIQGPVVLHVKTKKGRGYRFAEENPGKFHGIGPFNPADGTVLGSSGGDSYTAVFGRTLTELAEKKPELYAITAAMSDGTGLEEFKHRYPERFSDVGIAEEHAVTFAAGLACSGLHPVFAVYSTFLQRAYDELLHDVCLGNYPVTLAVDRAGIVGNDGETHQGIFDLSYLNAMPNMTVMAPASGEELRKMLAFSVELNAPSAVRYPRGNTGIGDNAGESPIVLGKAELLEEGSRVALLVCGPFLSLAREIREGLLADGIRASIVNARFVKPFDREMLRKLSETHDLLVTIEEGVLTGGFGSEVERFILSERLPIGTLLIGYGDRFIPQGSQEELRRENGLDAAAILRKIRERV